jgi:hypothetical protein
MNKKPEIEKNKLSPEDNAKIMVIKRKLLWKKLIASLSLTFEVVLLTLVVLSLVGVFDRGTTVNIGISILIMVTSLTMAGKYLYQNHSYKDKD